MSDARQIAPVGLCGELTMISRVRGVTASRTRSQSGRNEGAASGTRRVTPPESVTAGS